MSSKRKIRRKSCDGKQKHESRNDAVNHKMTLVRKGIPIGAKLWVYLCSFCSRWHVGHPPAKLVASQIYHSENK